MPSPRRPRVLLVDDYPGMVAAVERWLAQDCDVVGSIADGRDLLDAAERLQPDVIVLDLNMPHVNGLEVCQQVSQAIPETRIIVLTAERDAAIRHEALAAGAVAFIAKQDIAEDLLPAIKTACADSERSRPSA